MSLDSGFKENVVIAGTEALSESFELVKGIQLDAVPDSGNKGDTVSITGYADREATDVVAGQTTPAAAAAAQISRSVSLDFEKRAAIQYTGKEMSNNQLSYSFEQQLKENVRACVFAVSASCQALHTKIGQFAGTSGQSIFNGKILDTLNDAGEVLDVAKVGVNRKLILSPKEAAAYKNCTAVQNVNQMGSALTRNYGLLGTDLGFDLGMDQQVASVTAIGSITSGTVNGAKVAGDRTVLMDATASNLLVGDVITFAGSAKTYAVQIAVSGVAPTITLDRPLEDAVADGVAITLATGYGVGTMNIGGNLGGITIFNRLNAADLAGLTTMIDPVVISHESGLSILFGLNPLYKTAQWEATILYGVNVNDPRKLIKVVGL